MELSGVLGSTYGEEEGEAAPSLADYGIGGIGTERIYLDQDGSLRVYETDEELPVAEIGADGTFPDEEEREVGRVEDGYVYDSEGSRVGFVDTEISDDWQLELLEQELADADMMLGRTPFGPEEEEVDETMHVSRSRREAEEEE